jgi:hypothetical protein
LSLRLPAGLSVETASGFTARSIGCRVEVGNGKRAALFWDKTAGASTIGNHNTVETDAVLEPRAPLYLYAMTWSARKISCRFNNAKGQQ